MPAADRDGAYPRFRSLTPCATADDGDHADTARYARKARDDVGDGDLGLQPSVSSEFIALHR